MRIRSDKSLKFTTFFIVSQERPRSKSHSRGAQSSVNKAVHTERVLNHKIIIVGISDLATNLAHRLDAVLVSAVTDTGTLKYSGGKWTKILGWSMSSSLTPESWTDPLDFNAPPDEVITYMISAAQIVMDKCKGHNHANAHCELVYFHPMATPANYVSRGHPADLDPSNNRTSWFNQLSSKITDLAQMTTNSSAMSLSNATNNPWLKDRPCWTNWAEYVPEDVRSKKDCRTLTAEARDIMEVAVFNHIKKFTSFGRRLAE